MKTKFFFIFFILSTLIASVSSCTEDTDAQSTSQIGIEEYRDGGSYTGKLESEESNNNN